MIIAWKCISQSLEPKEMERGKKEDETHLKIQESVIKIMLSVRHSFCSIWQSVR